MVDQAVKPVVDGLRTKEPPTSLPPDTSPDLLNMLLADGAAQKRGGFTPLLADRLLMNAVRGTGYRATARSSTSAGSADGDFLIAPACMVAGHRPIYEAKTALTIEFFYEVGKLTTTHGGNSQSGGPSPWNGAPYTIKVRPILSKGPVKRSDETASPGRHGNSAIVWNTTATTIWGDHADSGLPFCFYLFNNSGTWQFRLSANTRDNGTNVWSLRTATSSAVVEEGGLYHVIGVVSGTRVHLRVARIRGRETPSYSTNEVTYSNNTLAWNKCPIQVLDCPQRFIENTTSGSTTVRPGLGLNASADGGYWFAAKRAEGRIEDIAIWDGDAIEETPTAKDRLLKLDLAQVTTGLLNYWNQLGDGYDVAVEATGVGNHLYFVPRGPVSDPGSGGKDGDSWFFNGQNSYALIDCENPTPDHKSNANWRYLGLQFASSQVALMQYLVRNNKPHGIVVDFWADSVEPQFEQVIAEIHSVLRLAIDRQGKIVGYCRNGDTGAAGTSLHIGELYQGPIVSNTVIQPGERYSVALLREAGGTSLKLFVGGRLDVTLAVNANSSTAGTPDSNTIGGITLGLGSYEHMIRSPNPDDLTVAAPNQLNTDHRSGFVGRVESFKIVTTNNGATLNPQYKPESDDDWRFAEQRVFRSPEAANRALLRPTDLADTIRNVGTGAMVRIAGHISMGDRVGYVVKDSAASPQIYELGETVLTDLAAIQGQYGHLDLEAVGAILYHAIAYYRFNVQDRDIDYGGAYVRGLEWRYNTSLGSPTTANQARNTIKHVHVQFSQVTDAIGTLGFVQRRCVESDVMDESFAAVYTNPQFTTHRQRPYIFRSPQELGPSWAPGVVRTLPGQAPVSMLAEWEVQEGGRRFWIAASGRNVYWGKPLWENDSPFDEAQARSVFLAGGLGSHIFAKATASQLNLSGTGTKTTIVFECWLKPMRLDGARLLAAKITPATNGQFSWCVFLQDGSVEVGGTMAGATKAWRFGEGSFPGGADTERPTAAVKAGVWNHLIVTIATAGVTVRVNGRLIPMIDANGLTGTGQSDSFTGFASDTPSGELYIGGLPTGRETLTFPYASGTRTARLEAFYGLLSEVRVRNAQDVIRWPTGLSGYPPQARFADEANTYLLLHLNEGDGWFLDNVAANTASDDAVSQVLEYYPIGSLWDDSAERRYSALVYRDRLMLTNGRARPQSIRFEGLQAPQPHVMEQLGMLPPVPVEVSVVGTTTAGTGIAAGTYLVNMTFLNKDGKESEPVELGSFVQASETATLVLEIRNIPRSHDPQVVGRRLYSSAIGGGTPLFNRDIDNDSAEHDLAIAFTTGLAVTVGDKVVPPRGRQLAVVGASLVIADLTDEPAGQNAFAFSRGDEPSYFTVTSTVVIDSQDGKPIIGIRGNLGQVFLSKRDSVYQLAVGAIVSAEDVDAAIRLVYGSDGIGGGHQTANNLIYGAGDRGVFVFDNTNARYLSQPIEPTWREFDRTDDGLIAMSGFYSRVRSEYWLSARRQTEQRNDRILVLRLTDEGAWSILTAPTHIALATLTSIDEQAPILGLQTESGLCLRYNDAVSIDGSDAGMLSNGAAQTLTGGSGLSGTGTSLTMSGANFSTVLGGLAGVEVEIVYNAGTVTRKIARNTGDTLFWTEPLPGWSSFTSFSIGGYTGYWTSPWLSVNWPSREQQLQILDLEFIPDTPPVTVSIAAIRQLKPLDRAFPTTNLETLVFDPSQGWLQQPFQPRSVQNGHYHRFRVMTTGPQTPFGLIGYLMRLQDSKAIGNTGRSA